MPSSIKPNQILESVASIDGDFCEKFIGSLNAPALFAAWYKQTFNDDGSLTDEFKAMVCLATEGTEGDPTTPPTVPPPVTPPPVTPPPPEVQPLNAPSLAASRGLPGGRIRLVWTPVPNVTHYIVYRLGQPIVTHLASQTAHDDFVPQGRSFVYNVQAFNNTTGARSPMSNEAYGYSGAIVIGQPPIQ